MQFEVARQARCQYIRVEAVFTSTHLNMSMGVVSCMSVHSGAWSGILHVIPSRCLDLSGFGASASLVTHAQCLDTLFCVGTFIV